MNIEKANTIPLSEILLKLGRRPAKERGHDVWYLSPFRNEKTPSFHIHQAKNVWHDFGVGIGGDVVSLVCFYLYVSGEDYSVRDALRWLRNMMGGSPVALLTPIAPLPRDPVSLKLEGVGNLRRQELIDYLKERGIPENLGRRYLKEAFVRNFRTGKVFFSLALRNEEEGYELRNAFFKGCIGQKHITFIRGTQSPASEVHVFEGVFDFLAALAAQDKDGFPGDVIILNSTSCLPLAFGYIKNHTYETLYAWLDNDDAGKRATEILRKTAVIEERLFFREMNKTYLPFKDVNDWHVDKVRRKHHQPKV